MLSDTDRMIQDTARRFAQARLVPYGRQWDRTGELPPDLFEAMGEVGLFGLLAPEAYGGSGLGFLPYLLALEEIAAGNGGVSTLLHVHVLGAIGPLSRFGNDAQKAQWLPALIAGKAIGCIALSEPHAGSDLSNIRTHARQADGGWRLNGVKQFVSNGARAKVAIVLAVTDPGAGSRSMSFFLVPTNTPGFRIGKHEEKTGQASSDTVQIVLEDCFVPDSAMMGTRGRALASAMSILSDGRLSIAAQAIGMARAAYQAALSYARDRSAFGKSLVEHQAVAFRLADMATQIDVARAFVHVAAPRLDAGEDIVKEASMAKVFAAEMAERVCSDAIQVHGGYGYLKDYPVERIWRDVRVCQIYEGTNDIQRLIIARRIIAS